MADCTCNNFPANLGNVTFGANVGIGTPSPGRRLHVYEDQHVLGYGYPALFAVDPIGIGAAYVTIQSSSQAYLWLNTTGGGLSWVVGSEFDGVANIFRISSVATGFVGDRVARLVINQNGYVGIGTPTPASLLHMKTTGTGWSPLTIEAESQSGSGGVHSANALEFRRSRIGGADAVNYDDLGNIYFSFKKAEAPDNPWVEGASIDSRVVNVGGNTGNWGTETAPGVDRDPAVGELTVNMMVKGIKREFLRCTVGKLDIGDGWLRVGPALIDTQHFARVGRMGEEAFLTNNAWFDGTNWQRDNVSMGAMIFQVRRDGGLRWHNAPAGGVNPTALTGTVAVTYLSATVIGTGTAFNTELVVGDSIGIGTEIFTVEAIASATSLTLSSPYQGATASGLTAYKNPTLMVRRGYTTFDGSMYIDGTYNTYSPAPPKEDMAPEEWLDWALEDAKKPRKPYPGLAEDPEEIKKYAKDVSRIAIGVARYAEHLRTAVATLEKRVAELEGRGTG